MIFKILNRHDSANRIEKNAFFDDDDFLNWKIDAFTKKRRDFLIVRIFLSEQKLSSNSI
jgi:hypothetical protein